MKNSKNKIARHATPQVGPNGTAPVAELAQKFLEAAPTLGQHRSLAPMLYSSSRLVAQIGHVPIGQVTTAQVLQLLTNHQSRSQKFHLTNLKRFFRWCQAEGYLPANKPIPTAPIHLKIPAPAKLEILSSSELRRLLSGTKDVEILLWLALAAFAGLRTAEIQNLSWESIEPGKRIYLRPELSMAGKGRRVAMLPVLDAWLQPFYGSRGLVVKSRTVKRRLALLIRAHGLVLRPNMLRHACCAYRYRATGDSANICLEMGLYPALVNRHHLLPVTKADALEYFSLTPKAVGVQDWPALVSEYQLKGDK